MKLKWGLGHSTLSLEFGPGLGMCPGCTEEAGVDTGPMTGAPRVSPLLPAVSSRRRPQALTHGRCVTLAPGFLSSGLTGPAASPPPASPPCCFRLPRPMSRFPSRSSAASRTEPNQRTVRDRSPRHGDRERPSLTYVPTSRELRERRARTAPSLPSPGPRAGFAHGAAAHTWPGGSPLHPRPPQGPAPPKGPLAVQMQTDRLMERLADPEMVIRQFQKLSI